MLVIAKDHPGYPGVWNCLRRCESVCGRSAEVSLANPTLLNKNLVLASFRNGDLTNGLALPTDPNTPRAYRETPSIYYEPRLGFAWDVFGKGNTILRGMGGLYHMPRVGGGTGGASSLGNNPPQQRSFQILNGNIDNLVNLTSTAALFPVGLSALEVHSNIPSTANFSLGVQQEIGFKSVLEVSYVGAFARHLGERATLMQCRMRPALLIAQLRLNTACHVIRRIVILLLRAALRITTSFARIEDTATSIW
jgi:hypothetical protein